MPYLTKPVEFLVSAVIMAICLMGGAYSIKAEEYVYAFGMFVSAPTIPMVLWYLGRCARALEAQIPLLRASRDLPSGPEVRPRTDEVTFEQLREQSRNPYEVPGVP